LRNRSEFAHQASRLRVADTHPAIAASRSQPLPVGTECYRVSPPAALAGCDGLAGPGLINGNVITRVAHRDHPAVGRKRQRENRTILCLECADECVTIQVVKIRNALGAANHDEIARGVAGDSGQLAARGVDIFEKRTGRGVVHLGEPVAAHRNHTLAVHAEGGAQYPILMMREFQHFFAQGRVHQPDGVISAANRQARAIRRKRSAGHRFAGEGHGVLQLAPRHIPKLDFAELARSTARGHQHLAVARKHQ